MNDNLHPNKAPDRPQRIIPWNPAEGSSSAVWLAALPFVLVFLIDALPKLLVMTGLVTWESSPVQVMNVLLTVISILVLAPGFFFAWKHRWPTWSVTWFPFFGIPLIAIVVGLTNWINQWRLTPNITQELLVYLWIPLGMAVFLYTVTRKDPLRGTLAALPLIYVFWFPNMEFVDDWIEIVIKLPSTFLIVLAIAHVMQVGSWRTGLLVVLGMNLAVGALFSYAGTYHGGTLPFDAGGRPNLIEVARSLIPQLLASSSFLLGPLFARMYRQAGRRAGTAGTVAYHAALAGLLLVILANLSGMMQAMQSNSSASAFKASQTLAGAIWIGLGLYLAGALWLTSRQPLPQGMIAWLKRILLVLLPMGIPLTFASTFITYRWPISGLYGIPVLWELPHFISLTIGLAWLALSAWVITRREALPTVPEPARQVGAAAPAPR